MTQPAARRNRLHYLGAVVWLALTVSLASWWLAVGLDSLPARLHRMFVWEGIAFISLLVAGGVAILVAIRREHLRRQSLETFFLSFTHDLKTSLASVGLQAEGLREDWPAGAARTALDRLLDDVLRLQIQLENSLFVAQPDGRLLAERVSARAAIERLAADWPTLEVEVSGDADLIADARGFDTVVRNLLQNAVVHGGAGRVRVDIGADRPGAVARLTFTDNGRGVPVESLPRLGEPFNRGGQTGGSGMGLYVSRALAHRMRGVLRFPAPTAGRPGLTVVLELPGAR
jgi:signal transduction histidine kinase